MPSCHFCCLQALVPVTQLFQSRLISWQIIRRTRIGTKLPDKILTANNFFPFCWPDAGPAFPDREYFSSLLSGVPISGPDLLWLRHRGSLKHRSNNTLLCSKSNKSPPDPHPPPPPLPSSLAHHPSPFTLYASLAGAASAQKWKVCWPRETLNYNRTEAPIKWVLSENLRKNPDGGDFVKQNSYLMAREM